MKGPGAIASYCFEFNPFLVIRTLYDLAQLSAACLPLSLMISSLTYKVKYKDLRICARAWRTTISLLVRALALSLYISPTCPNDLTWNDPKHFKVTDKQLEDTETKHRLFMTICLQTRNFTMSLNDRYVFVGSRML